jgi:hypothetical protein
MLYTTTIAAAATTTTTTTTTVLPNNPYNHFIRTSRETACIADEACL